jgi:C_GCAxxG_C_C family probable redox protein
LQYRQRRKPCGAVLFLGAFVVGFAKWFASITASMNSRLEKGPALEKFLSGYNCSQAVLFSAHRRLNLDADTALKISTGLGAGIARSGQICGAVSGAILALSMQHGRGEGEDKTKTQDTYARVRAFTEAFESVHGSIKCRDLVKCDLATDAGQRFFKENNLLNNTCARCVETAIDLLEKAI